jgi:hypothetical protein
MRTRKQVQDELVACINKRDALRFLPGAEHDEQRRRDRGLAIEQRIQKLYRELSEVTA